MTCAGGISQEAGRDNQTMRICLRELRRCQQDRPKPNFLVLLGDRYGWRPLPEVIPATLFEKLEKEVRAKDAMAAKLLTDSYRRDDNAGKPIYELQPRGNLEHWHDTVGTPLRAALETAAAALPGEPGLAALAIGLGATHQEILHGALKLEASDAREHVHAFIRKLNNLSDAPLPRDFVDPDADAQTQGLLGQLKGQLVEHLGQDNVHPFTMERQTGGADDASGFTEASLKQFCDDVYQALSAVIEKQIARLKAVLPEEQEDQAHQDFGRERCHRFVGRAESLERIAEYLKLDGSLTSDSLSASSRTPPGGEGGRRPGEVEAHRVDGGKLLAVLGPSGSGKSALMAKAVERLQESVVRGQETEIIARYVGATPASSDLVQLLRNLVAEIRRRYPASVRSPGFSRSGSEPRPDAESGPPEGGTPNPPNDSEIPFEYNPLVSAFHEALQRPTADRPLFLFLDALDQLTASNNAHSLAWLPGSLNPHIRLIVSAALPTPPDRSAAVVADPAAAVSTQQGPAADASHTAALRNADSTLDTVRSPAFTRSGPPEGGTPNEVRSGDGRAGCPQPAERRGEDTTPYLQDPRATIIVALTSRLNAEHRITLVPLTAADGEQMLTNWLVDAHRTLQPAQRQAILETFKIEGSPLWLRTAAEEAARLVSWQPAPAFAPSTPGLLGQVLDRLSREEEHGDKLVSRTLSYLACARHGLAEDEILDILSADPEVMANFRHRSPNSPKVDSLPVSVWVRLHGDLAFFFAEHQAQGASLLGFYHRQLGEVAAHRYLAAGEGPRAHGHLARYFGSLPLWLGEETEHQPNARKCAELPYQQTQSRSLWDELLAVLTDLDFVDAKSRAGLVHDLLRDYDQAEWAWPGQEQKRAEEEQHQAMIRDYVAKLIAHASDPDVNPLPTPPRAADIKPAQDAKERKGDWTPLERIQAWKHFVANHTPWLGRDVPPAYQLAWNSAESGPVVESLDARKPPRVVWLKLKHRPIFSPQPACLQTMDGHSKWIETVSVTPDGRRAMSESFETLKIWNLESGQCLHTLVGDTGHASVTPDGRRAVSGSWGKSLKVWDLEGGQCLHTLRGHSFSITAVSVTPDGRRAVSGSEDHILKVWDLNSGQCLHTLEGHSSCVNAVSVTPNGRRAVSGSRDKTLKIWDLESGQCLHTLQGHSDWVVAVCITPDGRRAVSGSGGELGYGRDNTLKVWNLESGQCLHTLTGHSHHVVSVSVTPDGRRAVSGSWDRSLKVWDLESGQCLHTLTGHSDMILAVSVTPDGRYAVSGSCDKTLKVWDLTSGRCYPTPLGHSDDVYAVGVTPDGRRVVSGGYDETLKVWDMESGQCLHTLEGHSHFVMAVSFTPNGRRVVSGSYDKTIKVWDLATGRCFLTLKEHDKEVRAVSVTPDGIRLVSGSEDNTLKVWDLASGRCLQTHGGHPNGVYSVTVTPDGRRAVSGGWDNTVKVWDLATGVCLLTLKGHSEYIKAVSVTPDGRRAVSGSGDKTLKVWDLASDRCLLTINAHSDSVQGVSVTADGQHAVSGSHDGTLKVWDLDDGRCLASWASTHGLILSLALRLDLAVVGTDIGQICHLLLEHLDLAAARATPTRLWQYEAGRESGRWAEVVTVLCPLCGIHSPFQPTCLGQEIPCPQCHDPLLISSTVCDLKNHPEFFQVRTSFREETIFTAVISNDELKELADSGFRRQNWEAAATCFEKLLSHGEPLVEVGPKLVTCLLNAHETVAASNAARIEDIIKRLEAAGDSSLAAGLRFQLGAKRSGSGPKAWWKFWSKT